VVLESRRARATRVGVGLTSGEREDGKVTDVDAFA
jgi:sRNA-binding regulator protein Hfq